MENYISPRERRNSLIQAWLTAAVAFLALAGVLALGVATSTGGLFRPGVARGWYATFDYATNVFILMGVMLLSGFRVNDGLVYQLRMLNHRLPRRVAFDVIFFCSAAMIAVFWGVLGLHTMLISRARERAHAGLLLGSPESAVTNSMIIYWSLIALCLSVHLVGLFFNPVDMDTYNSTIGKILTLGCKR